MVAHAVVAVGANHPVTLIQQCLHKLLWPSHQLHAQAHDQEKGRPLRPGRARATVLELNF